MSDTDKKILSQNARVNYKTKRKYEMTQLIEKFLL